MLAEACIRIRSKSNTNGTDMGPWTPQVARERFQLFFGLEDADSGEFR